jgi:hypothetical protein
MNEISFQVGRRMSGSHGKQMNQNQGSSPIYHCFICNSLEHKIYDCPHKLATQEMFRDKVSHVELKKDEVIVNMVLTSEIRSQNPRLMLQQEKEPWKTEITNDWEKEEKLQKTFESMIQQMQTPKSTIPKEPTTDVGLIWTTKNQNQIC